MKDLRRSAGAGMKVRERRNGVHGRIPVVEVRGRDNGFARGYGVVDMLARRIVYLYVYTSTVVLSICIVL